MLYLQSKTKQKSNHNACAHLLKLKNCYQKMGFIKKSFKYTKKITSSPCLQKINTTLPPPKF